MTADPEGDRRLFWLIDRASHGLRQRIERLAADELGVTAAQLPAVFTLASKDCRPGELAEALGINAAAVTGLCDRMEAAGLLRRRPSPDDGRAQLLSLTAAGRRAAEKAIPMAARLQAELCEGFTTDEIDTVSRFLRTVIERAPQLGATNPGATPGARRSQS